MLNKLLHNTLWLHIYYCLTGRGRGNQAQGAPGRGGQGRGDQGRGAQGQVQG